MSDKLKLKGQIRRFIRWPLYLSVLLILLNVLVYTLNIKAGILVSLGVVIYIAFSLSLYFYHKPLILNDLITFANQYDILENRILDELALPYALIDMEGRMLLVQ